MQANSLDLMRRLLDFFSSLEVLSLLLTVLFGVGCVSYVGYFWTRHWIATGDWLLIGVLVTAAGVLSVAAAYRVPLALFVFVGTAAALGFTFSLGYGHLVQP